MATDNLNIDFKKKVISGQMRAMSFMEGDKYIQYIPSFNLSAYGSTPLEARSMMMEVIGTFFQDIWDLNEDEIISLIENAGYKRHKLFKRRYSNVAHIDKDGVLRNFDLPTETEVKEELIAA